ncbi:MAG: tRNA (mo5U34)-methyltransferase, partial [Methylococcaceae bacterium NSP1-1]
MIDYQPLYNNLLDAKADAWVKVLPQQLATALDITRHGNLEQWQTVIECLPKLATTHRLLDADAVKIGLSDDLSEAARMQLEHQLKALHPWRKGPYNLFGINIDTEWRSD